MKNFIVFSEDGEILRTGTCSDSHLPMQARDGESVIEGVADDSIHIIVNGKVQEKPVDESQLIAGKQSELRLIRNALLAETDWTQVSDAPLTKAKKDKYKSYRKALRDLPLKYDTITSIEEVNFPSIEDF
jgi:hypothetical protein